MVATEENTGQGKVRETFSLPPKPAQWRFRQPRPHAAHHAAAFGSSCHSDWTTAATTDSAATASSPPNPPGLERWSFRFNGDSASSLEEAFGRWRRAQITSRMPPFMMTILSIHVVALAFLISNSGWEEIMGQNTPPRRLVVTAIAMLPLDAVLFGILACTRMGRRLSPIFWQLAVVVDSTVLCLCVLCTDALFASALFNMSLTESWPQGGWNSNTVIQFYIGVVSAVALYFPLSPVMMATLCMSIFASYAGIVTKLHVTPALGDGWYTFLPTARANLMYLMLMLVSTWFGRRQAERKERLLVLAEWQTSEARAALRSDHAAVLHLLDMVCDGHVWLDTDGDTVVPDHAGTNTLHTTEWLREVLPDASSGRTGGTGSVCADDPLRFQALLATDAERSRFGESLTAATATLESPQKPAQLLTTTLRVRSPPGSSQGEKEQVEQLVDAELFVLHWRRRKLHTLPQGCRTFLVGIRLLPGEHQEALVSHWPSQVTKLNIAPHDVGGDVPFERGQQEDDARSTSALSTTLTGMEFIRMNFQHTLETMRSQLVRLAMLGEREHWLVREDELEMFDPPVLLGAGGFGHVVGGRFLGTPVAVKLLRDDKVNFRVLQAVANELRVLRQVRHPNIVLFHGACVRPEATDLSLVLELVTGVTLTTFVEQLDGEHNAEDVAMTDVQRHRVLLDIARALRYLHGRRPCIVHGDLKPSNVMVQAMHGGVFRAKLLDFGLARVLTWNAPPLGGTLCWMPPEVLLEQQRPRTASDVFSFGRLIYFVVTSVMPLQGLTKEEVQNMFLGPICLHWPGTSALEELAQGLVKTMLCLSPVERPAMRHVHAQLDGWAPE